MPEANGVLWRYLDDVDDPDQHAGHTCAGCGRRFVATAHRRKGDEHWCPGCKPVESIAHSVDRTLVETDRGPREADVGELLEEGDPR